VTDAGLEHLTGLHQLEKLELYDTGITDAGLGHLKELRQLRELGLSGTEVTDAGLEHLKGLRRLHTLALSPAEVAGLLDPIEPESQGPQFVGLDDDPADGYAARFGLGQVNEQLRQAVKERRQAEKLLLKEQQYLRYLLDWQERDRQWFLTKSTMG